MGTLPPLLDRWVEPGDGIKLYQAYTPDNHGALCVSNVGANGYHILGMASHAVEQCMYISPEELVRLVNAELHLLGSDEAFVINDGKVVRVPNLGTD